MEIRDEVRVRASRDKVYAALNDPVILAQAIPGCESLEKKSETEFHATVQVKVGPVKAKFRGKVTLSDLDPPRSYTISGQGEGGSAGMAKGRVHIQLKEDGDETLLQYEVIADVGGKLAQVGGRLLDGVARKMSKQFFTRFEDSLNGSEMPRLDTKLEPVVEAPSKRSLSTAHFMWLLGLAASALVFALWRAFS